jgi:hypothetical protein
MANRSSPARQRGPSQAVRDLKKALGLAEPDWQEFLSHALVGFADFEWDWSINPKPAGRLEDVPPEWFRNSRPLGFVTIRVLNEGEEGLAVPVARHLLTICDPGADRVIGPPGIGLAWLTLARRGLDPPIEPTRLAYLALDIPEDFFQATPEASLPDLCRLILETRPLIEAWDLHALFMAVDRACIHDRAPFRLFDALMKADWIPRDVKQEFCRGLLACRAEAERLEKQREALRACLKDNDDQFLQTPRMYRELRDLEMRGLLPGLQRHAVRALVEEIGEPASDVIREFLLRRDSDTQSSEAVSSGALDLIKLHAEELGPDTVRIFLRKVIKGGSASLRQAAYRLGADQFRPAFARPALRDKARVVRDWASKYFAQNARGHGGTKERRRNSIRET